MTAAREFVGAFCVICVAAGIMLQLVPKGGTERAVRLVLGLTVAVCLGTVAAKAVLQTDFSVSQAPSFSMDAALKNACEWNFRLCLDRAGVPYSKITVWTDNSADGGIVITKVQVATPQDHETVFELLGGEDATYAIETVDDGGFGQNQAP